MVETRSSKLKNQVQNETVIPVKSSHKRVVNEITLTPTKRIRTGDTVTNKEMSFRDKFNLENNESALANIHSYLLSKASKKNSTLLAKYFRVEEYGMGDIILGIKVPEIRFLSKRLDLLPFPILRGLIKSKYHEERLLAIINVVEKYKTSQDSKIRENIFNFFVEEMISGVDNWDLVDTSASQIVGAYLRDKPDLKRFWLFEKFVKSNRLWDRRIAIISTQYFIKYGEYDDTLELAGILLHQHAKDMPRVMLRYSIEKLSVQERKKYMKLDKK
ncbi:7289_t:CDS:2 [Diversispora eburnea]|uniref:7289_t:CDS:1 n=1 Tax=Diversispora eburnea TaxID=1213867 RepID=A0A9N8ZJ56_9GLOM|nr:7289_t:CDS:2 [Diversispora eburnea]